MLKDNNTAKLLGMEDVIVTDVEETKKIRYIRIEQIRTEQICPCCGEKTTAVYDYRIQKIKECDILDRQIILKYRKRRYICKACGKRFYEKNRLVQRYKRMTPRLIEKIISSYGDMKSSTQIARENHVSVTTAIRYFDLVNYKLSSLPEVLSVDEFKGNAGGHKFQTIVTDTKNHKVLDVLPTRKAEDLNKYFMSFPNRKQVKYITMDMSQLYFDVMKSCFPNATIVIDKFHVARQAQWALENVRKNVQRELPAVSRKYFKKSRFLLLKRKDRLKTDEEKDRLARMLEMAPRLAIAYYLKELFLKFTACKNYDEAKKTLKYWIAFTETKIDEVPEFKECLRAVRNWYQYILNAFKTGLSNGYTEGCNNRTKVLKRVCFGVRNFNRFRNRILYISHTVKSWKCS